MKSKILLLCLPLLFAFNITKLEGIFGIRLKTLSGENFPLSKLKLNKNNVIVFLLPDCPACESYSKTLNDFRKKYKNSGFEFYGVFPGKYNTTDEMITFKNTYKIEFPLLQDPENILVQELKASVAPSAFLIKNTGEIVYKGRIDDWMYAPGKKRATITKHELKDALSSVSQGKPVQVKETNPIGCILE